jgi:hypothetical protein
VQQPSIPQQLWCEAQYDAFCPRIPPITPFSESPGEVIPIRESQLNKRCGAESAGAIFFNFFSSFNNLTLLMLCWKNLTQETAGD